MPRFDRNQAGRAGRTQEELFGAGEIGQTYDELLRLLQSSPLFAQMMQQNLLSANALRTRTAGALGRAGATTTGIGALSSGASQSARNMGAVGVQGQLGQQAFGGALENVHQRMSNLPAFSQSFQKTSFGENLLGSLGGILGAIAPFAGGFNPLAMLGIGGGAAAIQPWQQDAASNFAPGSGNPANRPGANYSRAIGGQRMGP